jgi:hypothetical protein
METEMIFHQEGLEKKQIEILNRVGPFIKKRGFYLGGGTALSIYFGHRKSIDLDWFTTDKMGDAFVLAESLSSMDFDFVTKGTAPGTLHGTINGIRVSFFEFRYPPLHSFTTWNEMNCTLASLDDLACMKLSAIAQRGLRKDFCDLYFLGKEHCSLSRMLDLYKQKFGIRDIAPVLYGLTYFDDAEEEPMPSMIVKVTWKTIKGTIQDWVKDLSSSL